MVTHGSLRVKTERNPMVLLECNSIFEYCATKTKLITMRSNHHKELIKQLGSF